MLSAMNTVVQALVWTTLAGLLYAVWLNGRTGTSPYSFSQYWGQTVHLLRMLWLILAVGLILSLIIFGLPKGSEAAAVSTPSPCVAMNYATPTRGADQEANTRCVQTDNSVP